MTVMVSMLMLGLLVVVVLVVGRMFRRSAPQAVPYAAGYGRTEPLAYAAGGQDGASDTADSQAATPEIGARIESQGFEPGQQPPLAPWGLPEDFDTAGFLRQAKTDYIRMRHACDKADVNDILDFTTPEVYAEIKLQLQARAAAADVAEVLSIDAVLLGIETLAEEYLAGVKLSGTLKASPDAPAVAFAEVWNLAKPVTGGGRWLLAGIRQPN